MVGPALQNLEKIALAVAPHLQDRVNDQSRGGAQSRDCRRGRIHKERPVVGNQLENRVRARPAVASRVGIVYSDRRLAYPSARDAGEIGERRPGKRVGFSLAQLLRRDIGIEGAHEAIDERGVAILGAFARLGDDRGDERVLTRIDTGHSGISPSAAPGGTAPGIFAKQYLNEGRPIME